jgi:Flp pilus assembly protein TadG
MILHRNQTGLPEATRGSKRPGVAAAEFAILAPFLFFLIIGMFELARGIMIKQMLNDAARKACRSGVQAGSTNANITAEINNILTDNNIATSDATITITVGAETSTIPLSGQAVDASTARPGLDYVSVKVGIPMSYVNWAGTFFLSGSTVESETVVMLRQG